MPSYPPPIIRVNDFTVPPYRFVDVRNMPNEEATETLDLWNALMIPLMAASRDLPESPESLCQTQRIIVDLPPGASAEVTLDLFRNRVPPDTYESDLCPEWLSNILFGMFLGAPDRMVGALSLYNIELEFEDNSVIEVRAMSAMAVPFLNDNHFAQQWIPTRERLIEDLLPMADGRDLDIVQWQYPIKGDHTWVSHAANDGFVDLMIAAMDARGHPKAEKISPEGRVVPESHRRQGKPPRPGR